MFDNLTEAQLRVLEDMVSEWRDKSRHGELERELEYSELDMAAYTEIQEAVYVALAKKHLR